MNSKKVWFRLSNSRSWWQNNLHPRSTYAFALELSAMSHALQQQTAQSSWNCGYCSHRFFQAFHHGGIKVKLVSSSVTVVDRSQLTQDASTLHQKCLPDSWIALERRPGSGIFSLFPISCLSLLPLLWNVLCVHSTGRSQQTSMENIALFYFQCIVRWNLWNLSKKAHIKETAEKRETFKNVEWKGKKTHQRRKLFYEWRRMEASHRTNWID